MDDKGPLILVVAWASVLLSLVFLSLRLWAKLTRNSGLWWDDHVLILSWVLNYATAIIITNMVAIGSGQHIFAVQPSNIGEITLLANIAGTPSILAAQLSKTSFGITLLRIATEKWIKATVWFAIITINIAMTVNFVSQWIQCSPAEKYWNPSIAGTCWPHGVQSMIATIATAYSGSIDVLLALLPWRIVMGLQMKKAEKIGVATAMSMGLFAGVVALLKAAFIPGLEAGDYTYLSSDLVIFSFLEVGLSIIAASIPVLRVLVRDTLSSRKSSDSRPPKRYFIDRGAVRRRETGVDEEKPEHKRVTG